MKKKPFDLNIIYGYEPSPEVETLRRAVEAFNKKIRPYPVEPVPVRQIGREIIHFHAERGREFRRSYLNF